MHRIRAIACWNFVAREVASSTRWAALLPLGLAVGAGCSSSEPVTGGSRSDAGAADAAAADAADAAKPDACVPDCGSRSCGPDPSCGSSCGACPAPTFCNDRSGECLDIDLNCPASGTPLTTWRSSAIGVATNELRDGRYNTQTRSSLLANAGIKRAQLAVLWDKVQPQSDTWDWKAFDDVIGGVHDSGLDPVVLLTGVPAWAADTQGLIDNVPAYAAFVTAAVKRYGSSGKGWVTAWQFENEPNLPLSPYGQHVDNYIAVLAVTHDAIHQADPQAKLWAPAVVFHTFNDDYGTGADWPASLSQSSPMLFLDSVLAKGSFDAVSIHIYEPDPARMLDVQLAVVERMVAHDLRSVPLIVNEGHFGTGPGRSPANDPKRVPAEGCVYGLASEALLAQDVGHFYSCLLGSSTAEVLWFNANDRFTAKGAPCYPDDVRKTGLFGFAEDPNTSFEPAVAKDAYYVVRELARRVEQKRLADARIAAVPSPCRLEPATGSCATELVFGPVRSTKALAVREGQKTVACIPPGGAAQSLTVSVGKDRLHYELFELPDCSATGGKLVDDVFVRGEEMNPRTRAALFALDGPCQPPDATATCAVTLVWWTEGVNETEFPFVKLFAGANMFQCVPANTFQMKRTGAWQASPAGILYRVVEASGCSSGSKLGQLLSTTRAP